jgi:hypothetical protein
MANLLRYFAGGFAILFALDLVAPAGGSALNFFHNDSAVAEAAPAINVVDRAHKGDRLAPAASTKATVVSKEVREGATSVGKSIVTENVSPASAARSTVTPAATARESRILEGCDPAFSSLAAAARANFSVRCLS